MTTSEPPRTPTPRPRSKVARRAQATEIARRLALRYPEPQTALHHGSAWELLVATILSAQSTDETVNRVTPGLFKQYPTVASFAGADITELEEAVHATGFFRNKSRALKGAAGAILERHGGEVPDTMEELVELPGVGRKTANVVLGSFFGSNVGVVVDTHVARLSYRLGLTNEQQHPEKIERDLMDELPAQDWTDFSHRLIYFGREVCAAKDPRCDECELNDLCPSAFKVGRFVRVSAKRGASKKARPRSRTANPSTRRTAKG